MRNQWLGVAAAALLGGCAVVDKVSYPVTSFAEIPLKDKAKIKVVAGSPAAEKVAKSLRDAFGKEKSCSVVESGADYWFVVDNAEQARGVTKAKAVSVVSEPTGNGSQEVLKESELALSSAAKAVNVAVYETRTLAPVHYLEVPMYDGDLGSKARADKAYADAFAKDVVERVKDAFLTQEKKVDVPVPLKATKEILDQMAKGQYAAVVSSYDKKKIDIKKVNKEMVEGTYKGDIDVKNMFADYAVYLMAKEAQTSDPEELEKLRAEQLFIIENCDDAGLAEAVPVALARLDYKLAHLGE